MVGALQVLCVARRRRRVQSDDAGGPKPGMRDSDIRAALDAHLRQVHAADDSLIRHELGVCAGGRRIDVAVVNGEFVGYEIKSDEDSLIRLTHQADAYGRVLDRAIIVTTSRHLDKAVAMLPAWWGVTVARKDRNQVVLEPKRLPDVNDSHDAYALAQLLWREEALEELRGRGKARGLSGRARHYVWVALADAVPISELRVIVRTRLRERRSWTGDPQRAPSDATSRTLATPSLSLDRAAI